MQAVFDAARSGLEYWDARSSHDMIKDQMFLSVLVLLGRSSGRRGVLSAAIMQALPY